MQDRGHARGRNTEGSVGFTECELGEITLALIMVPVFIILLWAVDGGGLATWSSPDGGVRHSSSGISGDNWLDQDGVGGVEVGDR
jgi:hypothetical protein